MAALAARKRGANVVVVEKGTVKTSGAAGSGFDHWMDCPANPHSKVDPESYTRMPLDKYKGGYGNYIATYITARDSYDVLLELEQLGMKIRDEDDEFAGAPFRDEESKLLYAYDYQTRNCLRVWGTTMKPAIGRAMKGAGVKIYQRTMATSLLTEDGRPGSRVVGCTAMNVRTGAFKVFKAKAVVMAMATPERLWIFSSEMTGLVGRDGPPTNAGNGHAMAFRAGAEFVRMESSTHEEWGGATGIGSVMFGSGSNFASWYPCSIVDANGKEIPWLGTGNQQLKTVAERTQEGHTWTVYQTLTQAGFDPNQDLLQVYEMGSAPPGWRRLRYGALAHDWTLKTSLDGLYAAGQQIFDCIGVAQAASTGRWAGTQAADYALKADPAQFVQDQVEQEKKRIYAPLLRKEGIEWKELCSGIAKVMQDYCGDRKNKNLMRLALKYLDEISEAEMATLTADNPHELMRALEAMDILTCCEMITHACLARQASCSWLFFDRLDFPDDDPDNWHKWITLKHDGENVVFGELALDYAGDLEENYAQYNKYEH